MNEWVSGIVEANGIRLHYVRTGGAKPPLVLAHGFTDDGLCWTPIAEDLTSDYDVVMVDARGHGRSEVSTGGYGAVNQATDLAGVIAALGLRSPAVLGHSMGAITALALAGTFPDLPSAILLEDPPALWMAPPGAPAFDANTAESWRTRITAQKQQTRDELIAAERIASPNWSDGELEPWADAKLRYSPDVIGLFDSANAVALDWRALLARIRCPALLITADVARGALVNDRAAATLRELVPNLTVAHIPGAGHSIRRDQPSPYLAAVRSFLTSQSLTD